MKIPYFFISCFWIIFGSLNFASASNTFYVDGNNGNDLWDGTSASATSGSIGPKRTIQAAINIANTDDTIIVAPLGTNQSYSGPGNVDLQFNGSDITLKSLNGPTTCIIDCNATTQQPHRALLFTSGESENCIIDGFTIINGIASAGGAVKCSASNPTIKNCIFQQNQSQGSGPFQNGGGAIYCTSQASPTFVNCAFLNNRAATNWGGAALIDGESVVAFRNCLFAGNAAYNYGGAIYASASAQIDITNCTFTENSALNFGAAVRTSHSSHITLNITNSIFWNNVLTDSDLSDSPQEISLDSTSVLSLEFSTVKGGVIFANDSYPFDIVEYGTQNDNNDPDFITPGQWNGNTWTCGNYRLASDSPGLNSGDNSAVDPDDTDLAGNDRIASSAVDRGAYEATKPDGPDLNGQFTDTTLAATSIPGDKATATVAIANVGNQLAEGLLNIEFYFSDDPFWDDSDTFIAGLNNLKLNLPAGDSTAFAAKLTVPPSVGAGNHYLLAVIDPDNGIDESDKGPFSNVLVKPLQSVVWQFGDIAGRKNVKLTVYDKNNIPVTFALTGGWGEIVGDGEFSQIILHNTTAKSAFSITTKGKNVATAVGDIIAQDGSLRSIIAKTTDLLGNIEIAGTIAQLELRDVIAAAPTEHYIQIDGAQIAKEAVALKFRYIRDLSIIAPDLPIKSITCAEWLKTDNLSNTIQSPTLAKLAVTGNRKAVPVVAGNFEADLALSGNGNPAAIVLGSVTIAGAVTNSVWDVSGNVGSVTAAAICDSSIFVGVTENLDSFTGNAADFDAQYTIKSLTLKSKTTPAFTGTQIAAWNILKIAIPAGSQPDGYIQYHTCASQIPAGVTAVQVN